MGPGLFLILVLLLVAELGIHGLTSWGRNLSRKVVGARQLVRQDGGSGGPFYGAQPLQPTQTRAPTGERLRKVRETRRDRSLSHRRAVSFK